LRIAAAGDQSADRGSNQLLGALARRDDGPGDLETEDVGCSGRRRIQPAPLEDIGAVDPAAATWISTSPGPGRGTGRSTTPSSDVPSGCGATIAFIVEVTGWSCRLSCCGSRTIFVTCLFGRSDLCSGRWPCPAEADCAIDHARS
jgi:hypothetical protein